MSNLSFSIFKRMIDRLSGQFPAASFLLRFMAARGMISVCTFASQMVVAMRLGQKEYVAYAAASAVLLLSMEAQTLAGNLEVLAKRHAGIKLSAVLSNRLYFNVCVTAPALLIARSLWAGSISLSGLCFAVVAVILSAFFPGSYGDSESLERGLRCEAAVGAVFLCCRFLIHSSFYLFWLILCLEILGRSLVGLALAGIRKHLTVAFNPECVKWAYRYGTILLFQMAFQRLEMTVLPDIALPRFVVLVWALGSNILIALNTVIYQALIGYRVVESSASEGRSRRLWALSSATLSLGVLGLSSLVALRKVGSPHAGAASLSMLAAYFFVVSFENFLYMDFFFSMGTRRMLTLSVCRLAVVIVFALTVTTGVTGLLCLGWILIGKALAGIAEMKIVGKSAVARVRDQIESTEAAYTLYSANAMQTEAPAFNAAE